MSETHEVQEPLRILQLTAENVMGLKVVDISPDPSAAVIEVTGANAQGKTSVLDSIMFALASGLPDMPIRVGEDRAEITVKLGTPDDPENPAWEVTRKVALVEQEDGPPKQRTSLEVKDAKGATYPSPQAMLNTFLGDLTFDPLAFTRMSAAEQSEVLANAIGAKEQLDALAEERDRKFSERTEVNRTVKQLEGEIAGMDDVPDVEPEVTSVEEIEEKRTKLQEKARRYSEQEVALANKAQELTSAQAVRVDVGARIRKLQDELAIANEDLKNNANAITVAGQRVKTAGQTLVKLTRPTDEEFDALTVALEDSQAAAVLHTQWERKAEIVQKHGVVSASSKILTDDLGDIDSEKAALVAGVDMPVEGLGFDEDGGVTLNGIPFDQCSTAEQLTAAMLIGMAENPTLRVMRSADANSLDAANRALMTELAGDRGYQLWLERVEETGEVGIYMVEGKVAAVDGQPTGFAPMPEIEDTHSLTPEELARVKDDEGEVADAPTV